MNREMKVQMSGILENQALARAIASAYVSQADPTVEELTEVKTAVSEAFSNAAIHGYQNEGGEVYMEFNFISDDTIMIKVTDHGIGIEDIARAMEPLFTTDTGQDRSGMGFTVMESFMDKIKVDSRPGQGTTVTMIKSWIHIMVSDKEKKLEQIVAENTGLVKSVALRLSHIYGEDAEDLIQIGYIGLIKAARRFEPERGLKFSTYAVPLITGEIKSQIRDHGAIKVSRSLKAEAAAVRRAENDFTAANGRSPRLSELAAAAGLTEDKVEQALRAADAMTNFEEYEKIDISSSDEDLNVTKIDIAAAISSLAPKERQVIVMRYYKDMTQTQVAKALGISQVQVCRIEKGR